MNRAFVQGLVKELRPILKQRNVKVFASYVSQSQSYNGATIFINTDDDQDIVTVIRMVGNLYDYHSWGTYQGMQGTDIRIKSRSGFEILEQSSKEL